MCINVVSCFQAKKKIDKMPRLFPCSLHMILIKIQMLLCILWDAKDLCELLVTRLIAISLPLNSCINWQIDSKSKVSKQKLKANGTTLLGSIGLAEPAEGQAEKLVHIYRMKSQKLIKQRQHSSYYTLSVVNP